MPQRSPPGSTTVFHYRGNVTPPRDYGQWATLIGKLVAHWVDRYGVERGAQLVLRGLERAEPESVLDRHASEDYFKLYRHTVEAIKGVDAVLRVGGPATAQNEWIEEFLEFCEQHDLPADFVSTHHYPTDAFGESGDDTETQLANEPRSILREWAQDARRQAGGRPALLHRMEHVVESARSAARRAVRGGVRRRRP